MTWYSFLKKDKTPITQVALFPGASSSHQPYWPARHHTLYKLHISHASFSRHDVLVSIFFICHNPRKGVRVSKLIHRWWPSWSSVTKRALRARRQRWWSFRGNYRESLDIMVKLWILWWNGGKYGRLLQLTIFSAILFVAVLLLSGCENYFLTLSTFALLMSLFVFTIENDR